MLKTILSQVKEYKGAAFATPLFMLFEVAMEMVIPLLLANLIDDGVNAGNMDVILKVGLAMVACSALGLFGGVGGGYFSAKSSAGFAKNLRSAMFRNIQTFSFADIDSFSQASLITRMTTDVTNVQMAFQMILRMGVRAPASLVVAMIMAFRISNSLSYIYVIAIIFLAIVIVFIVNIMRNSFRPIFEKYDELNESIREDVRGIRVVKAYVREAFEKERFYEANRNIWLKFLKVDVVMTIIMPLMMATVYSTIIALNWFGAKEIIAGSLTTGELMSLLAYCMNILMSLMMFAAVFAMIMISSAPAKRVAEVIDHETNLKNPAYPVMGVPNGSVSFEGVNFGYHESAEDYVLKDINLEIASGETIGIIGGTGSAKTSLINLISRLYDVNEGVVKVGGVNVRDYDLNVLRNSVSVVLQKNVLFSGTILENLRWGNSDASLEDCKRACKLACADEFIEKMPEGYETYIEQGGTNVSGGQRQRLCIARALLKEPKVLILDDSTSAVDTNTDAKIRRAFREEIPNTTKFIIAQRISSIQDCDRIIVMDDGKISSIGTHDELFETNDIYRDVYESQNSGDNADFDKVTD